MLTLVPDLLALLARVLLYAALVAIIVVLGWALLRGPLLTLRERLARERVIGWGATDDIPRWAGVAGGALIAAFIVVSAGWYFGVSVPRHLPVRFIPSVAEVLPETSLVRAWYASDLPMPFSAGAVIRPSTEASPLIVTVNDIVLGGATGELFRVTAEGPLVRLTGLPGQRVRVTNIGAWDSTTHALSGVDAMYSGGRWQLDTSAPTAANTNSTFNIGNAADPMPGYALAPADADFSVSLLSDTDGPYVRVQAHRSVAFLQIFAHQPVSDVDGAPVLVRGQIRAHSTAAEMSLTLHDVVDANGRVVDKVSRLPAAEEWTTLWVRSPNVVHPSASDYFALGIVRVDEQDWFDIRELSVFAGLFPVAGEVQSASS
jgi:hypothetical protein